MSETPRKRIALLGATGSIGRQTLEVVGMYPDRFEIVALSARRSAEALIETSLRMQPHPKQVLVEEQAAYEKVRAALEPVGIAVLAAGDMRSMVQHPEIDLVLVALVGFAGLYPTLQAIEAGKDIALANKEALVVGGNLVMEAAKKKGVQVYPIDSEHSAVFQCLMGEEAEGIAQIILTASGGPFRGLKTQNLREVTPAQALAHPTWNMGAKISIDSATMMNKGLEIIEAHWLFGLPLERIEVLVHPQSIVHALVCFRDGSFKAHLGAPDMRVPILFALSAPMRLALETPGLSAQELSTLVFDPHDKETFPAIDLARAALQKGGNTPCVLNAANEVAVQGFLEGRLPFLDITAVIEACLENMHYIAEPSYDDYMHTDARTRSEALQIIHMQ